MTVAELIEKLKAMSQDAEVVACSPDPFESWSIEEVREALEESVTLSVRKLVELRHE